MTPLAIIAAASSNDVIGQGGRLPWHLAADLRRFRSITDRCPVIMGRKTFESIGHTLPGRDNIILSRSVETVEGAIVAQDINQARMIASRCARVTDAHAVFVIGGAEIYAQTMELADLLYLTRVDAFIHKADATLPPIGGGWSEIAARSFRADIENTHASTFSIHARPTKMPVERSTAVAMAAAGIEVAARAA